MYIAPLSLCSKLVSTRTPAQELKIVENTTLHKKVLEVKLKKSLIQCRSNIFKFSNCQFSLMGPKKVNK